MSAPHHPVPSVPPAPEPPRSGFPTGRLVAATVLLGTGAVVGNAVLIGSYTAYVKPVMRWPLAVAAALLLVAGAVGQITSLGTGAGGHDDHPGGHRPPGPRRRTRVPGAVLLAAVPLLVLGLLRPPPLGADSTGTTAPPMAPPPAAAADVDPLGGDPAVPRPISFQELGIRIQVNGGATLRGRLLSLEGMAVAPQPADPKGTVRIGRYIIYCCAADAAFESAYLDWPASTEPAVAGHWYRAIVRLAAVVTVDSIAEPRFTVQSVGPEPRPAQPYEY